VKLLQTTFDIEFENTVKSWAETVSKNDYSALIHVYIPYASENRIDDLGKIRHILKKHLPSVPVVGCSSIGNIIEGQLTDDESIISIMLFEYASTEVTVVPLYAENNQGPYSISKYIQSLSDLKGIEVITAASYQLLEVSGSVVDTLPEEIDIFGGIAVGDDKHPSFVFAGDCPESFESTVLVYYCGPELHLLTNRMFGWKPIGYPLKITKSDGPLIYEIDNKPAYYVYTHYLNIVNDDNFFYDALDFPWQVQLDEETKYLRHAKSVNPDGSILMSSTIPQGSEIYLTYGDPRRIMSHTKQTALKIMEFAPEVLNVFNCFGRKIFWSDKENTEISVLSKLGDTTGFSALGEIMRYKGITILNNLTIVTAAMREGPKKAIPEVDFALFEHNAGTSVTARLALFINTISEELMEKNKELNKMLYKASHDALTGILNRGAIERSIYEYSEGGGTDWCLVMLDLDDFKKINDNFGHIEGDAILKYLSQILSDYVKAIPNASVGRWGGEEFMIFISGCREDEIIEIAETLRKKIKDESNHRYPVTVSIGVTGHRQGESVLATISRTDELMYQAKHSGKDRVCSN
jgi:diguanylate cyclase (GGDEF)-like protein